MNGITLVLVSSVLMAMLAVWVGRELFKKDGGPETVKRFFNISAVTLGPLSLLMFIPVLGWIAILVMGIIVTLRLFKRFFGCEDTMTALGHAVICWIVSTVVFVSVQMVTSVALAPLYMLDPTRGIVSTAMSGFSSAAFAGESSDKEQEKVQIDPNQAMENWQRSLEVMARLSQQSSQAPAEELQVEPAVENPEEAGVEDRSGIGKESPKQDWVEIKSKPAPAEPFVPRKAPNPFSKTAAEVYSEADAARR